VEIWKTEMKRFVCFVWFVVKNPSSGCAACVLHAALAFPGPLADAEERKERIHK
jgi:hypothetical protein